jgi:NADH-quinone oxidoreductase subunit F
MTRLIRTDPVTSFDRYVKSFPGGRGLTSARKLDPSISATMLLGSGLRDPRDEGRLVGGRWLEAIRRDAFPPTVSCDALDPDPTSFGNRALLQTNPYLVVEGLLATAIVLNAPRAQLVIDPRWQYEIGLIKRVVDDVEEHGLDGECHVEVIPSLHERQVRRDLMAHHVYDPETVGHIANVMALGAGWFRRRGTSDSPGTAVVTVSGDVDRPGVTEIELGTTVRTVISGLCSADRPSGSVKAVVCGLSPAVLTGSDLDAPFSYDGLDPAGASTGTRGLLVLDRTSCAVASAAGFFEAYDTETCRRRCQAPFSILRSALRAAVAPRHRTATLVHLPERVRDLEEAGCCAAGVRAARALTGLLDRFDDEFAHHAGTSACPLRHEIRSFPSVRPSVVDGPMARLIDVETSRVGSDLREVGA